MITSFPYVLISTELEGLIGSPDSLTRMFRAEGDHRQMQEWFDAICEHVGPCVSPGGAAVYAKVSRAAVYKRMKAGGLTAFCFHITGKTKTLFGREKKLKEWPLLYIPVSECKAWGAELEQRWARLEAGRGSADDQAAIEAADVDEENPNPDFINYDPKDMKRRDIKYVATNDIEPRDEPGERHKK